MFGTGTTLHAIDEVSGEKLWDHQFDNSIATTPCISGKTLITSDESPAMYGIDVVSGTVRWQTTLEDRYKQITSGEESVFAVTEEQVLEFDPRSGEQTASHDVSNLRPESLCVHRDDAYVVKRGGKVARVASNPWVTELEDISSAPLTVTDDRVLSWRDNSIIAFDTNSGEYSWGRDLGRTVHKEVAVARGFLAVANRRKISMLDLYNGEELWSSEVDKSIRTPPTIHLDSILVGTVAGIKSFDLGDGSNGPYDDIDLIARQRPIVGPETVLVVTSDDLQLFQSPESVEAKSQIADSRRPFEDDNPPVRVDETVIRTYQSAADAFLERSFTRAKSIARDLNAIYDERVSSMEEAVERIEALETQIEKLPEYRTKSRWRRALQRAEDHFESGNYERTVETAEDALDEIEEVVHSIERASTAISELESQIEQVQREGYEVSEGEQQLRDAREQYDDGNYKDALEKAEAGIDVVADRVYTAKNARDAIDKVNDQVQSTEYDVSTARELVRDAESAYEANEYEDALRTAELAAEDLEETNELAESAWAAIEAAEELDTRHTGIRYAADQFGYTERLEAAHRAYDDDEYGASLRSAEGAKQAYQTGQWLVDGSIGGTMSAVVLYSVRPDLFERPARRVRNAISDLDTRGSDD
ncbi:outer membrane protein assembly factor BamB family protein [Halorubrum vacuolatum]|nr:PQQ-binding-like beta-propeller repeat protein [Halorubrum vacuolatum]